MTMNETTNMSAREISLARRRAMSQNGKTSLSAKATAPVATPAQRSAPSVAAAVTATAAPVDECEALSGGARAVCMARRRALSTTGKPAVKSNDMRRADMLATPMPRETDSLVAEDARVPATAKVTNDAAEAAVDQVCAALPSDTSFDTPTMSEARALCMARRQGMSSTGKTAIGKRATSASTRGGNGSIVAGNGRDIAKRRRAEMCSMGSDKTGRCRPTGRVRPASDSDAPQKVEIASTLSGQIVTGNNVERSGKVTGNEYGACRPVTGTEYIGRDQYDKFCGTRPQPAVAKVGVSTTSRAQTVSGTEVGRSTKVTGDETGSCRNVTGTEYFSTERFDSFCGNRPEPAPAKVGAAYTRGDKVVTGTMVGRSAKVTGDEPGSNRSITGTSYYRSSNMEGAGPKKVEVSHTGYGLPVSGTTVGSSVKVTGDERGECKAVSGTEYISNEQFASFCGSDPINNPRKVSVMKTLDGRPVTGTNVNRSIKVSGDESGSCAKLSGSQYYAVSDFSDLCERRSPNKVNQMSTLSERNLTGTQVGGSVKVTGDDHGNCKPVTGTEYLGREHFKSLCNNSVVPAPKPEKVGISRTWLGQSVSGTQIERSLLVTGDEYGACKPVTGTPYIGAGQYQDFCAGEKVNETAARTFAERSTPGHSITGMQPGIKGKMTGDARGACLPLSGTPYVGDDQYTATCATAPATAMNRGAHPRTLSPTTGAASRISGNHVAELVAKRPATTRDFTVLSPARDAWLRRDTRVTGTAYAGEGRVTGPIGKAPGMVSGTAEFRYTDDAIVVQPVAETEAERSRVTGEGLNTKRITGDDWERGSRVTGTEGTSASRRNPTQRGGGQAGHIQAGASNFRNIEKPETTASRITGSSGNVATGPAITLSGGARG
jgi:hypothetical protein